MNIPLPSLPTPRTPRPSPASGIALIIVLIVIMVLGILAGGFAYSMKVETQLARNASHDVEMEWLGRSGIELAKYILATEMNEPGPFQGVDCLENRWAGGMGNSNSVLMEIPMDNFPMGRGSFGIKIIDLDRKFNINLADEVILRQALILVGVDAGELPTIVDSILDWRDKDDSPLPSGTESSTYKGYTPPYVAKNGPIDDLSELLLIRGVTPSMYWGAAGGGQAVQVLNRNPFGRGSGFDELVYAVGLADLFTTLSGRQINLNTASQTQLQIVPEIDEQIAADIVAERANLQGPGPFRNPMELTRIGLPPMIVQHVARYFTVRSLVFEVTVEARIDNDVRRYVGLLYRVNPRDIQLIGFHWK
ncbi:MAG: general secretion pathway protein GspK [Verrucomicrobia bacterium]|nr:general secretion pathway protein GspK [Verrucomicrobiota bacterium]